MSGIIGGAGSKSGVLGTTGPLQWIQITAAQLSTGASSNPGNNYIDMGLSITITSANAALCGEIILFITWGVHVGEGSANKNAIYQIRRTISGAADADYEFKTPAFGEDGPEMAPTSKLTLFYSIIDRSLGSGDRTYKLMGKTTVGSWFGYLGETGTPVSIIAHGLT